jgi:ABC-type dipeptide/oligopeptide/nickel transport system permease component
MGRYIVRRVIQMIPLFIGISIVIFVVIQAAPGGPEMTLLATGRFVSPEILDAYRARLGLDQPIPIFPVVGGRALR